jgi:hypothetical protein
MMIDSMAYRRMEQIRQLQQRVDQLERGLEELIAVAEISEGPAAAYYCMLARQALLFRFDGLETKEGSDNTPARDVE